MSHQTDIFAAGAQRLQMTESIELTIQSMQAYGPAHDHWGVAWSGGKDSTATLTILCWLLDTGKIARPKTLTVFYADTRQELPPLAISALRIMDELRDRCIEVEVVRAPLDKRFMVYILGAACRRRTTTRCVGARARSRSTRWKRHCGSGSKTSRAES
ncbi:hypothetical protein [Burkholderia arboris]|uniref:hypothetical protein n=1 Tax=Burkholderia arboris TaxID=488730 RepID=UPI00210DAD5A|nr:hypothetical protein [Burkholderia arboris]UTV56392.1 hypothetical protein NLX30_08450 [Burkholderia arboris]